LLLHDTKIASYDNGKDDYLKNKIERHGAIIVKVENDGSAFAGALLWGKLSHGRGCKVYVNLLKQVYWTFDIYRKADCFGLGGGVLFLTYALAIHMPVIIQFV
jgi:hypothetical protein